MEISKKLEELGMIKIGKDKEFNGFFQVMVFVIPEHVQLILQKNHNLRDKPDITIMRKGEVSQQGDSICRKDNDSKIEYFLAQHNKKTDTFQCVVDMTGEKINKITGDLSTYDTSEGEIFIAKKYYDIIKAQD